jgi:hypothetical protein
MPGNNDSGDISHYTPDKADIIVQAIANGYTTIKAAHMAGICHMTAYNWRKQYPEFAERWLKAVEIATDCVESIVACAAMSGNLTAAFYWLRHHRPHIYNREALIKLSMLQAAIQQQAGRGGGNLTIHIDENGIPQITESQRASRVRVYMPDNGRGDGKPPEVQGLQPQLPSEAGEPRQQELLLEPPVSTNAYTVQKPPQAQPASEPEIIPPQPQQNVVQFESGDMKRWRALAS